MRCLVKLVSVLFCVSALCGCATRTGDRLDVLLRDLESLQRIKDTVELEPEAASEGEVTVASEASEAASARTRPPAGVEATWQDGTPAPDEAEPASVPDSIMPETGEQDIPDEPAAELPGPSAVVGAELSGVLTIQPDCLVQVSVEEDPSLDGSYPVNAIGAIQLGYVGPVILYNKTEEGAAQKIGDVLRSRHFKNANVKVRILRASYDRVQMVGAVNNPGLVKIGAGDSVPLNDLLLRVGGVTPGVRIATVRIVRGGLLSPMASSLPGEEYTLVNEEGLPAIPEVYVRNNDLVRVYEGAVRGRSVEGDGSIAGSGAREILVLGEVKRPGIYRFSDVESCTIMHLIFKMGGLPPYANTKTIRVMRLNGDGHELEYRVDAREVLRDGDPREDFELQDGDRVVVPARRISLF